VPGLLRFAPQTILTSGVASSAPSLTHGYAPDLGLTAVDPSHLRALADPGDTAACQSLRGLANAAPDPATVMSWAYYTADGFYFAGSWQNKVGTHGFLYVFDSAWKLKEVMLL
jgi:hypothetical protein